MIFHPDPRAQRVAPHVLRAIGEDQQPRLLRLTHVFHDCVYAMWVTDAAGAYTAQRPKRYSFADLEAMEKSGAEWGRLLPPDELAGLAIRPTSTAQQRRSPAASPARPDPTEVPWLSISPLIDQFSNQKNLERQQFTARIAARANELGADQRSLRRLVYRYYYFGQIRSALVSLSPGPIKKSKAAAPPSGSARNRKRPGAKSKALEAKFGKNRFVVTDADRAEMVARVRLLARQGTTVLTYALQQYLKKDFPHRCLRNQRIYLLYNNRRHPQPVSIDQFERIIRADFLMTKDLAKNLRTKEAAAVNRGSLAALGPGEVYEIDATGGRIVLVTSGVNPRIISTPVIYLVIDRWSRFIVGCYISLNAPSWEEARYALLVTFSSRDKRFAALGVDTNDITWPRGVVCSLVKRDRGSDLTAESIDRIVVGDLKADAVTLPALTPNGKAIVERAIKSLKIWMGQKVVGVYADRPLDPYSKGQANKKRQRTVHSLSELYRCLVRFIESYNNTPHSHVKRIQDLVRAGLDPTPQNAYLWGLKNISGLSTSTYADEQLIRLCLGVDQGSYNNEEVRCHGRQYAPSNEAARHFLRDASRKWKKVEVRIDRTFPHELYIPQSPTWAKFVMKDSSRNALGTTTLDEAIALKPVGSAISIVAQHEAFRKSMSEKPMEAAATQASVDRSTPSAKQTKHDQFNETAVVKALMTQKSSVPAQRVGRNPNPATHRSPVKPDWVALQEAQRYEEVRRLNNRRKK